MGAGLEDEIRSTTTGFGAGGGVGGATGASFAATGAALGAVIGLILEIGGSGAAVRFAATGFFVSINESASGFGGGGSTGAGGGVGAGVAASTARFEAVAARVSRFAGVVDALTPLPSPVALREAAVERLSDLGEEVVRELGMSQKNVEEKRQVKLLSVGGGCRRKNGANSWPCGDEVGVLAGGSGVC